MQTTFIYTLVDPRCGEVRYVGKTDDPIGRAKTHLRKEATIKGRWVQSLIADGVAPVLEILDEVPFDEWMFWEQYWIQFLRGHGCRLMNGDNGGLGRFRSTPAINEKISATLRGRPNPAQQKQVFAYDREGRFCFAFDSFAGAAQAVNGSHTNICRSIKDGRAAYGFIWKEERREKVDTPYVNGRLPVSDLRREIARGLGFATKGRKFSAATKEKQRQSALRRWSKGVGTPSVERV